MSFSLHCVVSPDAQDASIWLHLNKRLGIHPYSGQATSQVTPALL